MNVSKGLSPDFFHPLSSRLVMLLTTIFTQRGSEDLPVLDYLPEEESRLLREKATVLLGLPDDKRIGVVIRQMRRQVQLSGTAAVESADPSWVLSALRGEQPVVLGIVLAHLSQGLRAQIMAALPPAVRDKVPSKEQLKRVPPEMVRVVRGMFEENFASVHVPALSGDDTAFYFRDIATFTVADLLQLVRALGLEELGAAFLTMGKRKLAELCQRLEEDAAYELLQAVKETEPRDATTLEEASALLMRILTGVRLEEYKVREARSGKVRFETELFQRAGLYRLARALRYERPGLVRQMVHRLPQAYGKQLLEYVDETQRGSVFDDGFRKRIQDLILYKVWQLSERRRVDVSYAQRQFRFWEMDIDEIRRKARDAEEEAGKDEDEDDVDGSEAES